MSDKTPTSEVFFDEVARINREHDERLTELIDQALQMIRDGKLRLPPREVEYKIEFDLLPNASESLGYTARAYQEMVEKVNHRTAVLNAKSS